MSMICESVNSTWSASASDSSNSKTLNLTELSKIQSNNSENQKFIIPFDSDNFFKFVNNFSEFLGIIL